MGQVGPIMLVRTPRVMLWRYNHAPTAAQAKIWKLHLLYEIHWTGYCYQLPLKKLHLRNAITSLGVPRTLSKKIYFKPFIKPKAISANLLQHTITQNTVHTHVLQNIRTRPRFIVNATSLHPTKYSYLW